MNHILAIVYFALFGIAWPYYLGGRTRGKLLMLCMAAPTVAFFFGMYA